MPTPVLHVIAGPHGVGKSTFQRSVLAPSTLEFVNADHTAAERWPGAEAAHAYDAARLAEHTSFVAETVFSHESKVELLRRASQTGYIVVLHVILVSEALAVARVEHRVANGGHFVPEDKIRSRHRRLWSHVAQAADIADETIVYDNSSATNPYRVIAAYRSGLPLRQTIWPRWAPPELVNL